MGAHRTGTTSLQRAIQKNKPKLKKNGVTFWGPQTTRGGRFSGLLRASGHDPDETARLIARNKGVITVALDRMDEIGQRVLIVSEENILGSMRANLRSRKLYPDLQSRLERFHDIFGPVCTRIGLAIRPYQDYWASTLAFAIPAGHAVFAESDLDRLVTQPRSWRHVVQDIAAVFPKAEIAVWDFGGLVGRTEAQFRALTGGKVQFIGTSDCHNASPGREALRELLVARGDVAAARGIEKGSGRYMPFNRHQRQALMARYQDDLTWLGQATDLRLSFANGQPRPDPASGEPSE